MKSLDRIGLAVGISIFLLNMFDGLATAIMLASGHFVEVNPLMSRMIDSIGNWFLVPKILLAAPLAVLLAMYWKRFRMARIGSIVVLIVYAAIAINHIVIFVIWKGGFFP